ncbi:MAG TPA: hypothetical protein VEC58_09020 [Roseiarcus sp.]|jgi:hypothetical protein|nr:hypothetical protein [Roseiarcus sp.]
MSVPTAILIEAQSPGDSSTLFRLRIDEKIVGENLTAAQTHLLIGEILERVALPEGRTMLPADKRRLQKG